MKADLWKKIDEVFEAAKAQPPNERPAFLGRAVRRQRRIARGTGVVAEIRWD
jgi:hypothetical protein